LTTIKEEIRRETRRDLPLGLGTSVTVHAILIVVFALFVAAAFVVSTPPESSPQKVQILTIMTLTREPHVATRIHQAAQPETTRIGVSRPTHDRRMVEHHIAPHAPSALAGARPAAARHSAAAPSTAYRAQAPTSSGATGPANAAAASNGNASTASNGTGGTGPGDPGDATGQGGGGWSDHAPGGGPFGDRVPDATRPYCTPGRGGFLNRR
jgi:hypothetical protein